MCGATYDSTLVQADVYVVKTDLNGAFVLCQPLIIAQPSDTSIEQGSNAVFIISTSMTATSYQWQVDSSGIFVNLADSGIYSGTNTSTLSIDSVLLSMNNFQFQCIVTDDSICADTSRIAILTVTNTTGISSVGVEKNVLFPNPAQKQVSISGAIPEAVVIYDIYGKIVARYFETGEINVSFLSNGLYYVKLFYKKNESVQKFIKN